MDCIKYVNSKDIRKYLYDIDYKLNVEQQFFLIVMCNFITLKEKISALEELCDFTEDSSMHSITNPVFSESLGLSVHEFIRRYICDTYAKFKFIKDFSTDFVYEAELMDSSSDDFQHIGYYRNYDNCLGAIRDYAEDEYYGKQNDFYRIRKFIFSESAETSDDCKEEVATCILSKEAEVLKVDCGSVSGLKLYGVDVSAMLISIPMPFKRGDIVKRLGIPYYSMDRKNHHNYSVFLSYTPSEIGQFDDSPVHDGSDILYWGLFPDENGFYKEHTSFYYDLEYADKAELEAINRKLIPLGEMEKGKLAPDLFFSAVSAIELNCQLQVLDAIDRLIIRIKELMKK